MRSCYVLVGKNKKRNISWIYRAYVSLRKANEAKDYLTERISELDQNKGRFDDDYNFQLKMKTLRAIDKQLEYDYDSVIYYFLTCDFDGSLKP